MADDIDDLEIYQHGNRIELSVLNSINNNDKLVDISVRSNDYSCCDDDPSCSGSHYLDSSYACMFLNREELVKIREWINLVLSANQDKQ